MQSASKKATLNANRRTVTRRTLRRRRRKTEEAIDDRYNQDKEIEEDPNVDVVIDKFCKAAVSAGLDGLKAEYTVLTNFVPKDTAAVASGVNRAKNRFGNIPCYDRTRVVLKYQVPPESDYIHANWIDHPTIKTTPRYMCCQAPLSTTIGDMWRLIWQERPRNVVVLCQMVENGKSKCADYFPRTAGELREVNTFNIECIRVRPSGGKHAYETYDLRVSVENEIHNLFIYQWMDWPDFGTPASGDTLIRLLRVIRSDAGNVGLIHCSAGVGRTGTIVGIIYTLKALLSGQETSVLEIMKDIRSCRANCVQNEGQYMFIYKAVFDFIKTRKKQRPEVADFTMLYDKFKIAEKEAKDAKDAAKEAAKAGTTPKDPAAPAGATQAPASTSSTQEKSVGPTLISPAAAALIPCTPAPPAPAPVGPLPPAGHSLISPVEAGLIPAPGAAPAFRPLYPAPAGQTGVRNYYCLKPAAAPAYRPASPFPNRATYPAPLHPPQTQPTPFVRVLATPAPTPNAPVAHPPVLPGQRPPNP